MHTVLYAVLYIVLYTVMYSQLKQDFKVAGWADLIPEDYPPFPPPPASYKVYK